MKLNGWDKAIIGLFGFIYFMALSRPIHPGEFFQNTIYFALFIVISLFLTGLLLNKIGYFEK